MLCTKIAKLTLLWQNFSIKSMHFKQKLTISGFIALSSTSSLRLGDHLANPSTPVVEDHLHLYELCESNKSLPMVYSIFSYPGGNAISMRPNCPRLSAYDHLHHFAYIKAPKPSIKPRLENGQVPSHHFLFLNFRAEYEHLQSRTIDD